MRYYGVFDRREADFPMNFGLMALGLDGTLDQNIIKTLIQGKFTNLIGSLASCHLIDPRPRGLERHLGDTNLKCLLRLDGEYA